MSLASSIFPWDRNASAFAPARRPQPPLHRWHSRSLKDTFADSLKHVNRLYNRAFGHTARKVIAHMPHFLDRTIVDEMQAAFPEEWEATSAHRLRSPEDMQFAFAYYWFLMSQQKEFDAREQFEALDIDHDGRSCVNVSAPVCLCV